MAMFHSHVQVIGRSSGRSATAAAAYRSGSVILDVRSGIEWDFTRKRGIDHSDISLPDEAPRWMMDRAKLWNSVEGFEKRKDAQLAREFEIAIPVELEHDEKIALARKWVAGLTDLGMVVDWSCHHLDGENPHFHAMATMRPVEGESWGKKAREWNDPLLIEGWRMEWAELANKSLAEWAKKAPGGPQEAPTISPLSLEAQGLDRAPQQRIKPSIMAMAKRGVEWAMGFVKERRITPPAQPQKLVNTVKEPDHGFTFLQQLLTVALGHEQSAATTAFGLGWGGPQPASAGQPSIWDAWRAGLSGQGISERTLLCEEGSLGDADSLQSDRAFARHRGDGRGVGQLAEYAPGQALGGLAGVAGLVRAQFASPVLVTPDGRDAAPEYSRPVAPAEPLPVPPGLDRAVEETASGKPGVVAGDPPLPARPANKPNPRPERDTSIPR